MSWLPLGGEAKKSGEPPQFHRPRTKCAGGGTAPPLAPLGQNWEPRGKKIFRLLLRTTLSQKSSQQATKAKI